MGNRFSRTLHVGADAAGKEVYEEEEGSKGVGGLESESKGEGGGEEGGALGGSSSSSSSNKRSRVEEWGGFYFLLLMYFIF